MCLENNLEKIIYSHCHNKCIKNYHTFKIVRFCLLFSPVLHVLICRPLVWIFVPGKMIDLIMQKPCLLVQGAIFSPLFPRKSPLSLVSVNLKAVLDVSWASIQLWSFLLMDNLNKAVFFFWITHLAFVNILFVKVDFISSKSLTSLFLLTLSSCEHIHVLCFPQTNGFYFSTFRLGGPNFTTYSYW